MASSRQFSLFNVVDGQVILGQKCTACDMANCKQLRTNKMAGLGRPGVDLMFVGKAPGDEDDAIGQPMTGKNGRLFRELLHEAGILLDDIYITNCLKCSPHGKELKDKYFLACKSNLVDEIDKIKPKALVAVGSDALKWLTGQYGIKKLRKHGLHCLVYKGIMVYPMMQPAQIFHAESSRAKERLRNEMVDDLIWLKEQAALGKLGPESEMEVDYKIAYTTFDVHEFMQELMAADELSVDMETAKTDFSKGMLFPGPDTKVVCVGFSKGPGHARAIPLHCPGRATLHWWTEDEYEYVKNWVIHILKTKKVYGQNLVQFDQKWTGYDFGIPKMDITFDTMYGAYLLDEEAPSYSLDSLSKVYTTMTPWKKDLQFKDPMRLLQYQCKDVDAVARIRPKIEEQLTDKQKWLMQNICIPLGHELKNMEQRGVPMDMAAYGELTTYMNKEIEVHYSALKAMPEVQAFEMNENVSFNYDSPADVAKVMEHYLKLPCVGGRTSKGVYVTGKEVLNAFADKPFIQHILACRKYSKLSGTYCEGFKDRLEWDGNIHTSYMQFGTVTGRLASENPNLQNIPREDTIGKWLEDPKLLKKMFSSIPGYCWVYSDYCLTGDTEIITSDGILTIEEILNLEKRPGALSSPDAKTLEFQPITNAWYNGVKDVYRVTLEDGSTVRCTSNHKWMMWDGTFKETKDLVPGLSIPHVKTFDSSEYRYVNWYLGDILNSYSAHRLVAEYALGPTPEGYEVDHKNADHKDWRAENLQHLTIEENRGQAAQRWWDSATEERRKIKLQQLQNGFRKCDFSGENNSNFGNLQGEKRDCKHCLKSFYSPPSHNAKYCSRECYLEANNGWIEVDCLSCGEKVVKRKSKGGSFCSRSCAAKHRWSKAREEVLENHKIKSIEYVGKEAVYDIEVEKNHTFVLANGMISHNSQAELRTLAMYSLDPTLILAYQNDEDIHKATAAKVYNIAYDEVQDAQRSAAKFVNFGVIYGRDVSSVAEQFAEAFVAMWKKGKICSGMTENKVVGYAKGEADKFYSFHKATFPKVWEFMNAQEAEIKEQGYQETFFGRRRHYDYIDGHAIRQAYNFKIQSTANEFTFLAIIRCAEAFRKLGLDAFPILTVHDSIGFMCKVEIMWQVAKVVKYTMENLNFPFMNVPMKADLEAGLSWGGLKKIDVDQQIFIQKK